MRIGVYGLGRFGAFWAARLSQYFEVWGSSRNSARSLPSGVRWVGWSELVACDTLILCNAISSMEEVAARLAPALRPGQVVMDTCSVKSHPLRQLDHHLADGVEIIGTHPMFGPDSGRESLRELPMVMCRYRASVLTFDHWSGLFRDMGLRIIEMDADQHDHEAAWTQGITHFIGRVLQQLDLGSSEIATLGYRRLLNIVEQTCGDSWELFVDLQRYNPHTDEMRHSLSCQLDKILEVLASESKMEEK